MKKVILMILPLLLISCSKDGFDKETSDFIENFNLKDAYSSTNTVNLTRVSRIYNYNDNNQSDILKKTTKIIFDKTDKNNLYYYEEVKEISEEKNSLKVVEIKKEDEKYMICINENNDIESTNISSDNISTYFKKFFYTSDTGGMYLNGYYYGDSIKINRKYYELFTFDAHNEVLMYHLYNDNTHPDYVVNTTFTVNKLGMLVSLKTSSVELNGDLCSSTDVEIIY